MPNLHKIKDIAEVQGMSIRALADAVGIKENQIHVMVRTNSTKIETLEKIAKALHVPITVFFNESVEDKSQLLVGNGQQMGGGGLQTQGTLNSEEHDEVIRLREENKYLKELMADKNERISELKELIKELKAQLK